MTYRILRASLTFLLTSLIVACSLDRPFSGSRTTPTLVPTLSLTVLPTWTPRPTHTPLSAFEFSRSTHVEHAGFEYPSVQGYQETYRPGLVAMASNDNEVLIGIAGGILPSALSLEEYLDHFVSNLSAGIEGFSVSEATQGSIGGLPSLSVDISGYLGAATLAGRVTCSYPGQGRFFVIFGNAPTDRWFFEGLPLFNTLLEEIIFFEPTAMTNGCPVSDDPTYGYTSQNPIRVGPGDFLSGPSLERAYLDRLAGPNGEAISYLRQSSLPVEDTIVDIYQVSAGSAAVSLYLDQYTGEPFRVPQGLTCAP